MSPRRALAAAAAAALLGLAAACGGDGDGGAETAAPPVAAEFSRAPYLTRVAPTSARMRWVAPDGAAVTLTATPAAGGEPVTARDGNLTGLAPDTRYAWSATIDGAVAAEGAFTTAPTDLSRPLDLLVFGDYGAPNDSSRAVVGLMEEQDPRLLVTAGDNAYLVTLPQLLDELIFGPMERVLGSAPNYGTVGDHDVVFPAGQEALAEAFEWPNRGDRYELRYGPVQVIAIGLQGTAADVPFVRRALARPGPLARLIVMHQPIHAGNPLLPVIAAADVTAVLAGHLHAYERREVAGAPGVPFLTVGTGGAPRNDERTPRSPDAVEYVAEFGLMRVRLHGDTARFAFVDLEGRERDVLEAPILS
ncbi:MAG: hypothetical protein AB7V62_04265 [Thermoleophilia bacterium]